MNNKLHEFLTDNFTKRYADGVEVVKPNNYNLWAKYGRRLIRMVYLTCLIGAFFT